MQIASLEAYGMRYERDVMIRSSLYEGAIHTLLGAHVQLHRIGVDRPLMSFLSWQGE